MFFEILKNLGTYSERIVDRTEIDGLIVSTAYTHDEGYETAIIDKNGTWPVQRYSDRELAKLGHIEWCEKIKGVSGITCLGGLGGLVAEKVITLERFENE